MVEAEKHEEHIWSDPSILKKDRKSGYHYQYCTVDGCKALNIPETVNLPELHSEHIWSNFDFQDRFGYYRQCTIKYCTATERGESRFINVIPTMAIKITESTYPIAVACLPEEFRRTHPSKSYGRYLLLNEKVDVYGSGMPIDDKIENNIVDGKYLRRWYEIDPIGKGTECIFVEVAPKVEELDTKI